MSATTYGWLVLLFPLLGTLAQRPRLPRLPARSAGWHRHRRDLPLLPRRRGRPDRAPGPLAGAPPARLIALELRLDRRRRRPALDPRGSPVGLHDPHRHGRLDPDPSLLDLLHGGRRGLRPLLLLPQLLRLLDAAAGAGGELPDPDRRLGVRGRGVLPADLVLVPAHDRHPCGDQGLRDQRGRRRGAGAGHLLHLQAHPHARLPAHLPRRPGAVPSARGRTRATSSPGASCCSSGRSPSPPRYRFTPGSPTRWRAPRRSAR